MDLQILAGAEMLLIGTSISHAGNLNDNQLLSMGTQPVRQNLHLKVQSGEISMNYCQTGDLIFLQ